MLRTVRLYGALAREFGPSFKLDVRSLGEACLALGSQIPGFRRAIEEGRFRVTCGASRGKGLRLGEEQISFGLPKGDLHIVPVASAAKSGGIGKIIVGTLIAAATWWAGGPMWLVGMGASLALTGVASLLTPKKKTETERRSYMFDGGNNTSDQGGCVPVPIGRCMLTGITISAGVMTDYGNGLPTARI
ncbi:tail assembly protein [Methylobacterium oxalidis]|uniref:tail assembly protein n=1 Tax=Methylobacterium oxalidis TaxID=944322 RepID=UPI003315B05C